MKNRLVNRVVYRTVFCTVSFFSLLFMTGFFTVGGSDRGYFTPDLFYFYTNLSNMLCLAVMLACLRTDVKNLAGGQAKYGRFLKYMKFSATVIIAITFFAYGLLLGDPTSLRFWNDIGNLTYHVGCPLLFMLDTLIFDEKGSVGALDPLAATALPIVYVVVIELMGARTGRYPYFFLDMGALGFGGLMMWIGILLAFFLLVGYGLFLKDKRVKGKWDFSGTRLLGARED